MQHEKKLDFFSFFLFHRRLLSHKTNPLAMSILLSHASLEPCRLFFSYFLHSLLSLFGYAFLTALYFHSPGLAARSLSPARMASEAGSCSTWTSGFSVLPRRGGVQEDAPDVHGFTLSVPLSVPLSLSLSLSLSLCPSLSLSAAPIMLKIYNFRNYEMTTVARQRQGPSAVQRPQSPD